MKIEELRSKLEHVAETNAPAFQELIEKARNPGYEFSDNTIVTTLKSYDLLDANENVSPEVREVVIVD